MKKITLFSLLGVIIVISGLILVVGRGEEPQYPYMYTDHSTSDPFSLISKEGLIEDVDYYLSLIDQVHGDPYRQVTKQALLEKAEEVKSRIRALESEKTQLVDAYFYLQEVAAFMQDEHTMVWFLDTWYKHFPEKFPLAIRVYDGNVYVVRDLSPAGIPMYAELLSVNGKLAGEMIDECWKFVSQTLPHYKRQIAEETFGTWLQAYFKSKPPWQIVYRYAGQKESVEVPAISTEDFREKAEHDSMYSESSLEVNGEVVPFLKIPKFYYEDRNAYDKFMDDFFNTHKDKETVVIDIRRNPGGDGRWALAVLDYLTDSPYLRHRRFDFKISKPFADIARFSLRHQYYEKKFPRLLWWFPFWDLIVDNYWLNKAESAKIGEYAEEHDVYWVPDPKKLKYKGKVYLLVSNYTNSAAVVFTAIFKHHGMGTIVGQETGGRQVFSSDVIPIEMPKSTLKVFIPVAILALPGNNPDRGILPDVEVEYTFEDYKSKKDKDLEKVKELILQDQQRR
jgi:hypothetical protein